MKQWLIGLIFGGVLALWSLFSIATGEQTVINYMGLISGAVIVAGALMLRAKSA